MKPYCWNGKIIPFLFSVCIVNSLSVVNIHIKPEGKRHKHCIKKYCAVYWVISPLQHSTRLSHTPRCLDIVQPDSLLSTSYLKFSCAICICVFVISSSAGDECHLMLALILLSDMWIDGLHMANTCEGGKVKMRSMDLFFFWSAVDAATVSARSGW